MEGSSWSQGARESGGEGGAVGYQRIWHPGRTHPPGELPPHLGKSVKTLVSKFRGRNFCEAARAGNTVEEACLYKSPSSKTATLESPEIFISGAGRFRGVTFSLTPFD